MKRESRQFYLSVDTDKYGKTWLRQHASGIMRSDQAVALLSPEQIDWAIAALVEARAELAYRAGIEAAAKFMDDKAEGWRLTGSITFYPNQKMCENYAKQIRALPDLKDEQKAAGE